jgi:hypothetical protein
VAGIPALPWDFSFGMGLLSFMLEWAAGRFWFCRFGG